MAERWRIRVKGIVQGVGFRPFVYNLARRFQLGGYVLNDGAGVLIEVEGETAAAKAFITALREEAPPLAAVTELTSQRCPLQGERDFHIRTSQADLAPTALVAPDVATCPECQQELLTESDRRYRYPFINCTNCGPRYTIIEALPYDRANTTMREFIMCPMCQAEYEDPANRRFHAQPNACPVCGPSYRLVDASGREIAGDPFVRTRELIVQGAIIAIKGIGGYHLACAATDEDTVRRLRRRKHRQAKPLAVMFGSLEAVKRQCYVDAAAEALLTGKVRPIVLLPKRPEYCLAPGVAPDNAYLGAMLPYAPVHWLLLKPEDVWVMTSGNISEEPIVFEDEEALQGLSGIADYFLIHNRRIFRRADDSVVRVFNGRPYPIRRSRGLAPAPLRLSRSQLPVLACGGQLKTTFCLTREDLAFLSPHIGDLTNVAAYQYYCDSIEHLEQLLAVRPQAVAYDLHPDYLTTKYAFSLNLPRVGVQHHHAHIAAVLGEHGYTDKVIGVALDGTGYGPDGNLWGGEFLVADCREFYRAGHCRYWPLPGGELAIRQPWRLAVWQLYQLYGRDFTRLPLAWLDKLPPAWELVIQATERGLNAPLASGAGRIFDTVAALLGICTQVTYEGQAASELEQAATGRTGEVLPYQIEPGVPLQLDMQPALAALCERLRQGVPVGQLAADFHATFAQAIVAMVKRISQETGITTAALGGGVWQNMILLHEVCGLLAQAGIKVLLSSQVPVNDGGIAFGQAIVAGERSRW